MADTPKTKAKADEAPKRLNRAVSVSEALGRALEPAMRKRGFASRDLLTHWSVMAPPPYDKVSRPDKLTWPRGERGAEGAVLFLSCHQGHALALAHQGAEIAAAVNRYFGYLLVSEVRQSRTPFTEKPETKRAIKPVAEADRTRVDRGVAGVEDPSLREALRDLGIAMARRR